MLLKEKTHNKSILTKHLQRSELYFNWTNEIPKSFQWSFHSRNEENSIKLRRGESCAGRLKQNYNKKIQPNPKKNNNIVTVLIMIPSIHSNNPTNIRSKITHSNKNRPLWYSTTLKRQSIWSPNTLQFIFWLSIVLEYIDDTARTFCAKHWCFSY